MTRLRSTLVVLLLGGTVLAGDNDAMQREEIVKSMLTTMDKLSKTLSGIRDEETAKAATEDLKKSTLDWRSLRKKADAVPPPSKAEAEQLARKYKDKMEQAQKQLIAQIARVQQVPGGKEALADLPKIFEKKGPN
jgi:cytochrome c556